jgi:fumarate hydratase subunit beta
VKDWRSVILPLDADRVLAMRAGERFLLTGVILTARDKAHQRIAEMTARGEAPPLDFRGQTIYFVGPSPAPPGRIIGAAGPTTSSRMDPFTAVMLQLGVVGFIGKGKRGPETRELLRSHGAVYFSSFGGAGAYLSERIAAAEVVAFADLGPEAIYRLEVRDFPVIVANDAVGGDLYEISLRQ